MEAQQKIEALERRVADLEALVLRQAAIIERQAAIIERQEARIQELERRLRLNSSNSSKPPSSDPPGAPPPAAPKTPSGRKPGGQPGHPPANRQPFPESEVDQFVPLVPDRCEQCQRRFSDDARVHAAVWATQQTVEIPPVCAQVTEFQQKGLHCASCDAWTVAEWPADLSWVGPRLQAIAACLSGRFRLSRREVGEALIDLFGPKADLSLGTMANLEQATSEALAAVHEQAHRVAQRARMANIDETGWYQRSKLAWLWAMSTSGVIVFRIDPHRGHDALAALIGKFSGVLASDRGRAYLRWPAKVHQLCWAHLKRDFRKWEECKRQEGRIGSRALQCERQIFELWHRFKAGAIGRTTLRRSLRPIQRRLRNILRRARKLKTLRRPAGELLKHFDALWVFARIPGVEPTNNAAERVIRPAVLWRKGSFGCWSPQGARFVERMLTVVQTLRRHGRSVLEFLTQAIIAFRRGNPAPSLLSL